jgi:hypothetical protein
MGELVVSMTQKFALLGKTAGDILADASNTDYIPLARLVEAQLNPCEGGRPLPVLLLSFDEQCQ